MIFDRYLFKQLGWTTLFTSMTLAAIILLTQSLRFLELVIDAGASGTTFWVLTFLALPRFFEVILPLSLGIAVLFTYNRLTQDSEIAVMRTAGLSPLRLARPALYLAICTTLILIFITSWAGPASLSKMQSMRQVIKAEYSTILFRESVFNTIGDDITIYVRERSEEGDLLGLLIHDSRETLEQPVTIMASRGVIVQSNEGQQVVVYDGVRQTFSEDTGQLNRLDFTRYSIDLPESEAVRDRWKEPDERTIFELLQPDMSVQRDVENLRNFRIEIHRRILVPFLSVGFCLISVCCLLIGPVNRRGQGRRIMLATSLIIMLQAAALSANDLATKHTAGLMLMYLNVVFPVLCGLFILSPLAEKLRHKILYQDKKPARTNTPDPERLGS